MLIEICETREGGRALRLLARCSREGSWPCACLSHCHCHRHRHHHGHCLRGGRSRSFASLIASRFGRNARQPLPPPPAPPPRARQPLASAIMTIGRRQRAFGPQAGRHRHRAADRRRPTAHAASKRAHYRAQPPHCEPALGWPSLSGASRARDRYLHGRAAVVVVVFSPPLSWRLRLDARHTDPITNAQ